MLVGTGIADVFFNVRIVFPVFFRVITKVSDFALMNLLYTCDHFEQSSFTCAVFADKCSCESFGKIDTVNIKLEMTVFFTDVFT